jgi:hypothetical protein
VTPVPMTAISGTIAQAPEPLHQEQPIGTSGTIEQAQAPPHQEQLTAPGMTALEPALAPQAPELWEQEQEQEQLEPELEQLEQGQQGQELTQVPAPKAVLEQERAQGQVLRVA